MILKTLACGTADAALACDATPPRRMGVDHQNPSFDAPPALRAPVLRPPVLRPLALSPLAAARFVHHPDRVPRARDEQRGIALLNGLVSQIVLSKLPRYD